MTRKLPSDIIFQPPGWFPYTEPYGRLIPTENCWALWYYYVLALDNLQRLQVTPNYEGEPDFEVMFERIWQSTALLYNADPNSMANCWHYVQMERARQNLERILDGSPQLNDLPERIKFLNKVIIIQ